MIDHVDPDVRREMAKLANVAVTGGLREWQGHVDAIERGERYEFPEESLEYAVMRRDDFLIEAKKRGLA